MNAFNDTIYLLTQAVCSSHHIVTEVQFSGAKLRYFENILALSDVQTLSYDLLFSLNMK